MLVELMAANAAFAATASPAANDTIVTSPAAILFYLLVIVNL